VSVNTIKSWLSVLQASGIIDLLEPYFENLGKRIVKTPKLYFLDTGLACFLVGIRNVVELQQSTLLGALFETHVFGQLVRHHTNLGRPPSLYFYRDHYGHEVDFVISHGGQFQLIECKWAERPSSRQKGIEEFVSLAGEGNIISKTIINSTRGQSQLPGGIGIDDSIDLGFVK